MGAIWGDACSSSCAPLELSWWGWGGRGRGGCLSVLMKARKDGAVVRLRWESRRWERRWARGHLSPCCELMSCTNEGKGARCGRSLAPSWLPTAPWAPSIRGGWKPRIVCSERRRCSRRDLQHMDAARNPAALGFPPCQDGYLQTPQPHLKYSEMLHPILEQTPSLASPPPPSWMQSSDGPVGVHGEVQNPEDAQPLIEAACALLCKGKLPSHSPVSCSSSGGAWGLIQNSRMV